MTGLCHNLLFVILCLFVVINAVPNMYLTLKNWHLVPVLGSTKVNHFTHVY